MCLIIVPVLPIGVVPDATPRLVIVPSVVVTSVGAPPTIDIPKPVRVRVAFLPRVAPDSNTVVDSVVEVEFDEAIGHCIYDDVRSSVGVFNGKDVGADAEHEVDAVVH